MKKVLTLILTLCALSMQAQVFVGGTGKLGYANDLFQFSVLPEVGYEINERWAVGAGLGMAMLSGSGSTEVAGIAEPYVRFTAWQCQRVAFDVKALAEMEFQKEMLFTEIGLRPSLRFFINDHFDVSADFGILGARYDGMDWTPAFLVNGMSGSLGVAYKF